MIDSRFDESVRVLAQSAGELAVCGAIAAIAAVMLFVHLDRRLRPEWRAVPVSRTLRGSPYRATEVITHHLRRAPRLVHGAALSCFLFGHVVVPGIVFVLATFRFDGIGVPLIFAVPVAFTMWCCGWLLMRRSAFAPDITRAVASVSLALNVAMFGLGALHLAVIDARWAGPVHECSASMVLATCVFAAIAIPQSLLVLLAVRTHAGLYATHVA